MTDLALCWLTVPSAGPIELIHAAAAGGFSAVGMKLVEAGDTDVGLVGDGGANTTALLHESANNGVAIHRTSGFLLDERDLSRRYDRYLELSAVLGASHVSVIATDPDPSRLLHQFTALCIDAAEYGLNVTIEFAPFSSVPTIDAADRLIRRSGQTTASILLDALHLFRSGGTAADVASPPRAAISFLQLCDARADAPSRAEDLLIEARTDRLDPGCGVLPLEALLRSVPAKVPIEVEVPSLAQQSLSPRERAIQVAQVTRSFLTSVGRDTS